MGGKLSLLQNRTGETVEIRVWVDPARPDRFAKIIRIKPGGWKHVSVKAFKDYCKVQGPMDHASVMLMVYVDGGWTGKYILTNHLSEYVKVSCETNQDGEVVLRGTRLNFDSCRLKLRSPSFPSFYEHSSHFSGHFGRSLGKIWGCLRSEERI